MRRERLETERLILRRVVPADAPAIAAGLNIFEVSVNLLRSPHPYTLTDGEEWVRKTQAMWAAGEGFPFAVERRDEPGLIGSAGIIPEPLHRRGEMGYWFAPEHWGRGYATEAARAIIEFGFRDLALAKVHAGAFHWNPASSRVLVKAGMTAEGVLRQHIVRHGRTGDLHVFGITRDEFEAGKPS